MKVNWKNSWLCKNKLHAFVPSISSWVSQVVCFSSSLILLIPAFKHEIGGKQWLQKIKKQNLKDLFSVILCEYLRAYDLRLKTYRVYYFCVQILVHTWNVLLDVNNMFKLQIFVQNQKNKSGK